MKRLLLILLAAAILVFHRQFFQWGLAAHGRWTARNTPPPPPPKLLVGASFPAAASLARTVGGAHVEVVQLTPAGADPETLVPSPADLDAFFRADLVVIGGGGLERWAALRPPPEAKTWRMAGSGADGTEAADGGPFAYLDPGRAAEQATALGGELARRDAAHAADYAANAATLRRDLLELAEEFRRLPARTILSPGGRHAALARACGWPVVPLDLAPGRSPAPEQLEALQRAAREHPGPKVVLWDAKPSPEAELPVSRAGLAGAVFDPLLREEDPARPKDFLAVMRANLERLRAAGK